MFKYATDEDVQRFEEDGYVIMRSLFDAEEMELLIQKSKNDPRLQEEAFDYIDAPIKRVAQGDVPLPYSRELEQSALINPEKVIAAVKEIL